MERRQEQVRLPRTLAVAPRSSVGEKNWKSSLPARYAGRVLQANQSVPAISEAGWYRAGAERTTPMI
jgi:hypothetical protein